MTVHVYRSADAGAPTLSGQPGSLIAVWDACLINGYGSGGTAKVPPGGWTKAFSAANEAAYRLDAIAGTGRYLRVNDGGADARVALVRAYAEMSAVDSGTNPFTTADHKIKKSTASSSATRSWILIADQRFVYFFVDISDNGAFTGGGSSQFAFGDIHSPEWPVDFSLFVAEAGSTYTASGGDVITESLGGTLGAEAAAQRVLYPAITGLASSDQTFARSTSTAAVISLGMGSSGPELQGVELRVWPAYALVLDAGSGNLVGAIPGLHYRSRAVTVGAPDIVTIGGSEYLRVPSLATCCVRLDGWRP